MKLIYGISTRGAWSLGSRLILKERPSPSFRLEAANLRFIAANTSIPAPVVVEEWSESVDNNNDIGMNTGNGNGGSTDKDTSTSTSTTKDTTTSSRRTSFLLTKQIPGRPLSETWSSMSQSDKERIARQTAEYIAQLRALQSPRVESIDGGPVYSAFLFPRPRSQGESFGIPHGPFGADEEVWEGMCRPFSQSHGGSGDGSGSRSTIPEEILSELRARMPPATPYTFTHGDLTICNILVDEEGRNLTGILDWESAGYFPVWWEYAVAGMGLGEEDKEWKNLLSRYLERHEAGREFWKGFLSTVRSVDE